MRDSNFRLRSRASGLEIVQFWGPSGPLPPQNQLEKLGGEAPTFPVGFAAEGAVFVTRQIFDFRPESFIA